MTPGRFSAASGLRTGHRRTCLSRWQCSWWSSRPYRRQNPRPPFQGKPGIQNTLLMLIMGSWDTAASKVYKIDKWSLIFYPFSFKTDNKFHNLIMRPFHDFPKFVIISFRLDLRILIFTFNLVLINAASCYFNLYVNTLLCIWINQRRSDLKVSSSCKTQLQEISIELDLKVSASFKTNQILWVPINFGKMGATLPLGFPLPPLFVRKGLLSYLHKLTFFAYFNAY